MAPCLSPVSYTHLELGFPAIASFNVRLRIVVAATGGISDGVSGYGCRVLFPLFPHPEKYLTVGLSYMIIALLWIVLRKKEKAEERRERDLENKK